MRSSAPRCASSLALLLAACSPADPQATEAGSSSSGGSAATDGSATTPTTGTSGSSEAGETMEDPTTGGPWELGECNPIDPTMCGLPYPSMFHMRAADTPTGYQVAFTEAALPMTDAHQTHGGCRRTPRRAVAHGLRRNQS